MRTVFVHRFCGILSAFGMGLADVVAEAQRPFAATYAGGGREAAAAAAAGAYSRPLLSST
jgi:5-oxoprolinase (ATP-hydrolysing)